MLTSAPHSGTQASANQENPPIPGCTIQVHRSLRLTHLPRDRASPKASGNYIQSKDTSFIVLGRGPTSFIESSDLMRILAKNTHRALRHRRRGAKLRTTSVRPNRSQLHTAKKLQPSRRISHEAR
ncbi:hypothetical protein Nepgr_007914 [Nepenthes gracilis]|uniref:Uncharacterized protein n=1 Tax=Nepenthes gracilis TaxID=150966 RepID=A0AAD3XIS5_NEPGR|nr:hypothetical protein Nepgr_007914 [Nepenthes gracilis]